MKTLNFILMLLLLSATAQALDVTLTFFDVQRDYHYGETLSLGVQLTADEAVDGFFKVTLDCDKSDQDIYLVPVHLVQNQMLTLHNAPFVMTDTYGDNCKARGELLDKNGQSLATEETDDFSILSQLEFVVSLDKSSAAPGSQVKVNVQLQDIRSDFGSVDVNIVFNKNIKSFKSSNLSFSVPLLIESDVASGAYDVVVEISDSFGNRAQKSVPLTIEAIPSNLFINVAKTDFKVGEVMQFKVLLYETNGQVNEKEMIDVKVKNPIGNVVYLKSARSGSKLSYTFSANDYDGTYIIEASYTDPQYGDFQESKQLNFDNPSNTAAGTIPSSSGSQQPGQQSSTSPSGTPSGTQASTQTSGSQGSGTQTSGSTPSSSTTSSNQQSSGNQQSNNQKSKETSKSFFERIFGSSDSSEGTTSTGSAAGTTAGSNAPAATKKKSSWWKWLLLLVGVIILCVIGYYGYRYYRKWKKKKALPVQERKEIFESSYLGKKRETMFGDEQTKKTDDVVVGKKQVMGDKKRSLKEILADKNVQPEKNIFKKER